MKALLIALAFFILNYAACVQADKPPIDVGLKLLSLEDVRDPAKEASLDQKLGIAQQLPSSLKEGMIVLDNTVDGKDGAFAKAGIQKGEILTRIGSISIKDQESFDKWLSSATVGQTYRVMVMRMESNGKWTLKTISLTTVKGTTPVGAPAVAPKPAPVAAAAEPAPVDDQHRAYELKGDSLGMTLDAFKKKYLRKMPNDPRPAPFCSDSTPDIDIPTLLYKAEYAQAGIVCATPIFPYEANDSPPNVPTIAGAPAGPFVYRFVDNKLYEITVFFRHGDFDQVMNAVKSKYGEPTKKDTRAYENAFGAKFDGDVVVWSNAVSEITVFERAGTVNDSLLIVSDKELQKTAKEHLKTKVKAKNLDD